MANIGIVGAGVAGLQLGLYLRQQGIDTTLYADRSPEQLFGSRIPAIVARNSHTRERERLLGVNHWDNGGSEFSSITVNVTGEQPMGFVGRLNRPFIAVDMRIYSARLLEDFAARGGHVVVGAVAASDLERLSEAHDLLVIAAGRAGLTGLFPRIEEYSPFSTPQRAISTGIFRGITHASPSSSLVTFMPGLGEMFEFPIYSFEANLSGLGVEAVPGSPLEALANMRYEDDPQAFNAAWLDLLREHAPAVYARTNPETFGLTRPLDSLQGRVTPAVRRGYAQLANGKYVLAVGDAHITNDPITGQGANTASHVAFLLGAAICEATSFDEAFCQQIEAQVWDYAGPIATWSNLMLQPPQQHLIEMLVAAAYCQPVADAFVSFFDAAPLAGEVMGSPERSAAWLAELGWQGMPAAEGPVEELETVLV